MMLSALNFPRKTPYEVDITLLWSVLFLLFAGMVMVYSASIAIAEAGKSTAYNPAFYLIRHAIFLSIGLIAAVITFNIPVALWQKMAPWLFLIGIILLALVAIPGVGKTVYGARRWLPLGPVNLQPSELMKFFVVLYAADFTVRKIEVMHDLKQGFLPLAAAMLIVGMLLLQEPDFGALVVIITIAMSILFFGGIRARLFVFLMGVLACAFGLLIWLEPYRLERITNYLDPMKDPYGKGYQLLQALIAFARGEWFGVGLGASIQKLFYLPEAHTDFLLAVIAEELGFVGVFIVISFFGVIVYRAFSIGKRALLLDRIFASLVAQGIGVWIGVQSFINMGVNIGILPTKGLTLPLMSFGGSGILANCIALAVLLRIDWENRKLMQGGKYA